MQRWYKWIENKCKICRTIVVTIILIVASHFEWIAILILIMAILAMPGLWEWFLRPPLPYHLLLLVSSISPCVQHCKNLQLITSTKTENIIPIEKYYNRRRFMIRELKTRALKTSFLQCNSDTAKGRLAFVLAKIININSIIDHWNLSQNFIFCIPKYFKSIWYFMVAWNTFLSFQLYNIRYPTPRVDLFVCPSHFIQEVLRLLVLRRCILFFLLFTQYSATGDVYRATGYLK